MSEWGSYQLRDFVPYTVEVYERLLERLGEAFWPLHFLILAWGCFLFIAAYRGRTRSVLFGLAPVWCLVGYCYFFQHYSEINWAGLWFGWAYVSQGLLLAGFASLFVREGTERLKGELLSGALLAGVGLIGLALLGRWQGLSWLQAQTFGIHADATAVVTLGVLLMLPIRNTRLWLLALIPLVWLVYSGLMLSVLGISWALVLLISAGLGVLALAKRVLVEK